MNDSISRRDCLRTMGATAIGAGLTLTVAGQEVGESTGRGTMFAKNKVQPHQTSPTIVNGKIIQPQRELSVLHQTDVLVVGGGPAGVSAAIAAKRAGAEVTLVERYGHFGGLWSGGLVLLVMGHIVKGGKQVCQGICEEVMRRLDKMPGGIINRRKGVNPTADAEAVKYVMIEMIEEAGVNVFLHCWGVDSIVDGNSVKGAVFESKSGRQAILAKNVVDTTGDGDLYAAAGAEFDQYLYHCGLVSRIGNIEHTPNKKKKRGGYGIPTPAKGVNWVNMCGPKLDGLDVKALTKAEMSHRKHIWKQVQKLRSQPGCEDLYLVETAPQLGVRITRVLKSVDQIRIADLRAGTKFKDVVAVGGAANGKHGEWQIPYGCLVPTKVDNMLTAGRCVGSEAKMLDLVRLIPNCMVTGHAAGVAAAVATKDGCKPREVEIAKVQKILKEQEAYLG